MGIGSALGENHPSVPSFEGVFVAGGSHYSRYRRGGYRRDRENAERLRRVLRKEPCNARYQGQKDRQRQVCGSGGYLRYRGSYA